jgi:hypothetical protein
MLLACSTMILVALAWSALSGAVRQLPRSRTRGQRVETVVQFICGILSLLSVLTCFRWRRWAPPVRTAWGVSLGTAAGLSALVWGPPMPLIGLLFVAAALLVARAVTWMLDTALDA